MSACIIIIGLFLVYWIIGYIVIKTFFEFSFLFPWDMDDDTVCEALIALVWPLWIIILLLYLVWIFVSFIGDKIYSIPVSIVAYIKGRNKKND